LPRPNRRHARATVTATAILFTDRRPVGPCLVEDLSAGGLRVAAGVSLKRGRVVSALLDVPGGEALLCFAQVVRHRRRPGGEHELALAFLTLPREQVERLETVVARALAENHPCLEFFDTDDDGRAKRIILADDVPVVGARAR
jgi:hypothetical protein